MSRHLNLQDKVARIDRILDARERGVGCRVIGLEEGISRERVRQIVYAAERVLRVREEEASKDRMREMGTNLTFRVGPRTRALLEAFGNGWESEQGCVEGRQIPWDDELHLARVIVTMQREETAA
jgi:hypothetical protein